MKNKEFHWTGPGGEAATAAGEAGRCPAIRTLKNLPGETVGDIIAEKRARADEIEGATGRDANQFQRELVADLRAEADRLEAAWKQDEHDTINFAIVAGIAAREREKAESEAARLGRAVPGHQDSDVAKLREALELFAHMNDDGYYTKSRIVLGIVARAHAALAAPPRNYDVGTEEEQFERWQAFCDEHDMDCTGCPYKSPHTTAYCFAKWAQMPYEEDSRKDARAQNGGGRWKR